MLVSGRALFLPFDHGSVKKMGVYPMILLMEEILHQLISSFPIITRFLYIPGGAGFHPSTVVTFSNTTSSSTRP